MTAFLAAGALLAALALALLLRPLLKKGQPAGVSREALNVSVHRDQLGELENDLRAGKIAQSEHDQARAEIERRVLEDVDFKNSDGKEPRQGGNRLVAYTALAVPVLALGIYLAVGNPAAIRLADSQAEASVTPRQVEEMVERLAARLKDNPDDVEGWKMLGRSYNVLGRHAESANAYSRAAMRAPRDPELLADLADALAMARGQNMAGEPEELVLRALQIDPKNLKALALAGTAAFDRRDFQAAARYWERMLPLVQPGSEDARTIQANVDEARKGLSTPKIAAKGLQGTVRLSSRLAAKVSPDDTVFIFARAAQGPPMPLAVLRKQARELPVTFALDDAMAMAPSLKLSAFPKVIVGARISKSGSATPQPGDLQGLSAVVANDAKGVSVTIDTELPAK